MHEAPAVLRPLSRLAAVAFVLVLVLTVGSPVRNAQGGDEGPEPPAPVVAADEVPGDASEGAPEEAPGAERGDATERAAVEARNAAAVDAALAAWAWWKTTEEYQTTLLRQGRLLRETAVGEEQQELARTTPLDVLRITSNLRDRARDAFREAFEQSDVDAWDDAKHGEIVRTGFELAARHALETDPAAAVAWWERLMGRFPTSVEARRAKTTWLPLALPSVVGPEAARSRLRALADEVEASWRPELIVAVGDTLAMEGAYDEARAAYGEARALIPDEVDRNDPRGRLRGHLDLRLALVGRPAPALEVAQWFGDAPNARAPVLRLLDFTATWCGPCLKSLPHLEALQEEYADDLQVIALTREYQKRGVLPERPGLPRELYRGTTREAYVAHLEAFRERIGMEIPLGLLEAEAAKRYPVRGLPTFVLVDPRGVVAFVAVGGMRHHLLRSAIDLLRGP